MKMKIYYLAALLLSASLWTACSDSDDTQAWEELPTTPINIDGTNTTITLNGIESTTGQVTFKATSDTEATMTLTNVVSGYSNLEIPVTMTLNADGKTFSFTGSTTVDTAPETKSVVANTALLTVDASGSISTDSKLTVTLTAYGPGLNLGTYSDAMLTLTYSGAPLVGGIVYYTLSGTTPVLTLVNIIPGETTVSIADVYTGQNGSFVGEATTPGGATVAYSGNIQDTNGMTLALTVTMPDPLQLAGTYSWAEIKNEGFNGMPSASGVYVDIVDDNGEEGGNNATLPYVLRPLLGGILPQVMESVTLDTDGNILAQYSPGSVTMPLADIYDLTDQTQQMMWMYGLTSGAFTQSMLGNLLSGRNYQASSANLANWFTDNNSLMVRLNISAIITEAMTNNGTSLGIDLTSIINQLLNTDAQGLKQVLTSLSPLMGDSAVIVNLLVEKVDDAMLETLLDWVKNGVPLYVEKTSDGHTRIYLSREELDMFIRLMQDPEVAAIVTAMLPAEAQMAGTYISQICSDWDNLSTFNIGLELVKQ